VAIILRATFKVVYPFLSQYFEVLLFKVGKLPLSKDLKNYFYRYWYIAYSWLGQKYENTTIKVGGLPLMQCY